jgi:hypothetical protein
LSKCSAYLLALTRLAEGKGTRAIVSGPPTPRRTKLRFSRVTLSTLTSRSRREKSPQGCESNHHQATSFPRRVSGIKRQGLPSRVCVYEFSYYRPSRLQQRLDLLRLFRDLSEPNELLGNFRSSYPDPRCLHFSRERNDQTVDACFLISLEQFRI